MKLVCKRCLTAFISEDIHNQYIDRFRKQEPNNVTSSWKDHLKFENHYMEIPLPVRVYADFDYRRHFV